MDTGSFESASPSDSGGRSLILLGAVTGAALVVGLIGYAIVPLAGPIAGALAAAGAVLVFGREVGQLGVLAGYAGALARGESQRRPDNLNPTANAVAEVLENLGGSRGRQTEQLTEAADTLAALAEQIEPLVKALSSTTGSESDRAQAAIRHLENTQAQFEKLRDLLGSYSMASDESKGRTATLGTTSQAVEQNVHQLAESVDETAASIEEMTYSIKEVARNIEDLSLAAEQTATSMNQMDTSISEVESNVKITAQLAGEVARDAGSGAESVQRTLEGIDKIRSTVTTAASVITGLGERIREIGNILSVIEDVAEQTNLLALNAAIIAAQAGEHGRGFAVVADEIKELSDKTGASTKEISALIRAIQEESRNAVDAMAVGERNVHEGVELSREAEQALAKILESSEKSTQRFNTIAAATGEQARGSKIVADAVERIARSVQQVAAATAEQARGSEQLMRSAERIKGITHQVERSNREQGEGYHQINQFVEHLGTHFTDLGRAEASYTEAFAKLQNELHQLAETDGGLPSQHLDSLTSLGAGLREQANRLRRLSAGR